MTNLTVKEYANKYDVSTQAVYKRLKNGSLYSTEIKKKLYVLDDTEIATKAIETKSMIEALTIKNSKLIESIDNLENDNKTLKELKETVKIKKVYKTKQVENEMDRILTYTVIILLIALLVSLFFNFKTQILGFVL